MGSRYFIKEIKTLTIFILLIHVSFFHFLKASSFNEEEYVKTLIKVSQQNPNPLTLSEIEEAISKIHKDLCPIEQETTHSLTQKIALFNQKSPDLPSLGQHVHNLSKTVLSIFSHSPKTKEESLHNALQSYVKILDFFSPTVTEEEQNQLSHDLLEDIKTPFFALDRQSSLFLQLYKSLNYICHLHNNFIDKKDAAPSSTYIKDELTKITNALRLFSMTQKILYRGLDLRVFQAGRLYLLEKLSAAPNPTQMSLFPTLKHPLKSLEEEKNEFQRFNHYILPPAPQKGPLFLLTERWQEILLNKFNILLMELFYQGWDLMSLSSYFPQFLPQLQEVYSAPSSFSFLFQLPIHPITFTSFLEQEDQRQGHLFKHPSPPTVLKTFMAYLSGPLIHYTHSLNQEFKKLAHEKLPEIYEIFNKLNTLDKSHRFEKNVTLEELGTELLERDYFLLNQNRFNSFYTSENIITPCFDEMRQQLLFVSNALVFASRSCTARIEEKELGENGTIELHELSNFLRTLNLYSFSPEMTPSLEDITPPPAPSLFSLSAQMPPIPPEDIDNNFVYDHELVEMLHRSYQHFLMIQCLLIKSNLFSLLTKDMSPLEITTEKR